MADASIDDFLGVKPQAPWRRYVKWVAIAVDASNNSAILSRSQYRTGLTDFTTLNQQETALLSARNGATQARADAATALIALYAALGGGWDSTVIPEAPPRAQNTSEAR
jgi:multidrug efflux system outer membrane protein